MDHEKTERTIIREHENMLLVRVSNEELHPTIRFEFWYSKEEYMKKEYFNGDNISIINCLHWDVDEETALSNWDSYTSKKEIFYREIKVIHAQLTDFFRNTFRKKLSFYENSKKDEKILAESIYALEKLKDKPYDCLGLKSYFCDKCNKDSFIYADDENSIPKRKEDDLIRNYCCPFCGKRILDEE